MGDNRPDDQIPLDYRTEDSPKKPRPPEQPPYRPIPPGTVTLQGTPLTSNVWPAPKRGIGVLGGVLLGLGAVVFLLGAAVAFSATSLFVCIWFTGWMVIGVVLVTGGAVIAALR